MIEITIMTVDKYEDLRIWKESRDLNLEIYLLAKESELGKDFGLWNQLNRSLGSVMDNIAEGFERDGNAEFIQALSVAKASLGEAKSQLHRASDRNYFTINMFDYQTKTDKLANGIGSLINYLKSSDLKGRKFKGRKPKK
jgi:four helix bundle protein